MKVARRRKPSRAETDRGGSAPSTMCMAPHRVQRAHHRNRARFDPHAGVLIVAAVELDSGDDRSAQMLDWEPRPPGVRDGGLFVGRPLRESAGVSLNCDGVRLIRRVSYERVQQFSANLQRPAF